MSNAAARIAAKRGRELFTVETITTPQGLKYALISHRQKFGRDKRTIEIFDHTPAELERAKRIAKKYREDSNQ